MAGWGEGPGWGEFDWGIADGGGLLPVAANPLLTAPSLCFLVEIHYQDSTTLNLPVDLSLPPLRFASRDVYPTAFGPALFEKRVVESISITLEEPDSFGGNLQQQQFTVRLRLRAIETATPDITNWIGSTEVRGWLVNVHSYDVLTDTTVLNIAVGRIAAVAHDDQTIQLLCAALDPAKVNEVFPAYVINSLEHPYAPADGSPSGGLGSVVPHGWGVNRGLPGRYARARNDENKEIRIGFTGLATNDSFSSRAHGFQTGNGPYHVMAVNGTLPTGLVVDKDYWVIVLDDDTFQLAAKESEAFTNAPITISTDGSGQLIIFGGLPSNIADLYDFVVLHGNLHVQAVRQGGLPLGAGDYQVIKRTYLQGGRYQTAIRLGRDPRGQDAGVSSLVVDGQRLMADVDARVVSEWDWQRGLYDDIGGHHAIAMAGNTANTSHLVAGISRYGNGAIRCNALRAMMAESVAARDAYALHQFSLEVWFLLRTDETGAIVDGPRDGWQLFHDLNKIKFTIDITTNPATWASPLTLTLQTANVTLNTWMHIGVDVGATTVDLYINGVLIQSTPRSGRGYVKYGRDSIDPEATDPMILGGSSTIGAGAQGDLGPVRFSSGARGLAYYRRAHYLGRRNFVTCLREALDVSGMALDPTSWDTAEDDAAGIENHGLRCDGAFTDAATIDGSDGVMDNFRTFRGLRYSLTSAGLVTAAVDQAVSIADAAFSIGDPWRNIAQVGGIARASLAETIGKTRVRFQPVRDETGRVINFLLSSADGDVNGVGQQIEEVQTQLVYDPVTADIIRSYRAKRRKTDDATIELALGHEARNIVPGRVIEVTLRSGTAFDARVRRSNRVSAANQVTVTPYTAADYVYDPLPLPADPSAPPGPATAFGNMAATSRVDGLTVTVTIIPGRVTNWYPVQEIDPPPNPVFNHGFIPGGTPPPPATNPECIDEDPPDADATYIAGDANAAVKMRFAGAGLASGAEISNVDFLTRMRVNAGSGTERYAAQYGSLVGGGSGIDATSFLVGATYSNLIWSYPQNPYINRPWQVNDVGNMFWGVVPKTQDAIGAAMITQMKVTITQREPLPRYFRTMRIWRQGPATSTPALLAETTPSDYTLPLLTMVDVVPATDPNPYYYTFRMYDIQDRLIGTFGPYPVLVT